MTSELVRRAPVCMYSIAAKAAACAPGDAPVMLSSTTRQK
jgi:hypothetical protein